MLAKMPKFRARPLNKKTLERANQHADTSSIDSSVQSCDGLFSFLLSFSFFCTSHSQLHLLFYSLQERGLEKEKQLAKQVLYKELEEERARIPKANPYPYTTDFPVMPPKPELKQCITPEVFQLESLIRHEEELQRRMDEKEKAEREDAQQRIFRAQPILRYDPLPLPERGRRPLIEVQEFALNADHRYSKNRVS
ncbi:hypothetical protein ZIOFF_012896 [Zingiber officinale]|uniref:TPX2 C-terminal domain-containing protein n=1 Tax=Zingiber officinale TaxID=94328 RepID=A0A8J5HMA9_ZINOF|nr:hypothetical protein ZIOFF_012896 [Zingiber officinale]